MYHRSGHAVAQLVEALCYKSEGHGFNSWWVTGIFHWQKPSSHTMAPGLTQPLTEMSTRNISWGLRWPVYTADNISNFMCWMFWNLGASNFTNTQGLFRPLMGLLYTFRYHCSFKTDDNITEPQIKKDSSTHFHPVMWTDVVSKKSIIFEQKMTYDVHKTTTVMLRVRSQITLEGGH
jgi:hypothetical protein